MIAMEVAAAYPEQVRSMALLEPLPSFGWLAASDFADILGTLGPQMEAMTGRYQGGDVVGAYDALFTPQGLDWRSAAGAVGSGAVRQGIDDAATWFEHEAPALAEWSFRPEQAAAIDCPVLSWGAQPAGPLSLAARAFLHELFPRCEDVDLEGGDHFSVATDPAAVAEPIAAFISRHPAPAVLT